MKRVHRVRVAIPRGLDGAPAPLHTALLECLQHAGMIRVHLDNAERQVFDLLPPSMLASGTHKSWAESNAARLRACGYIAEPVEELAR